MIFAVKMFKMYRVQTDSNRDTTANESANYCHLKDNIQEFIGGRAAIYTPTAVTTPTPYDPTPRECNS